MPKTWPIGVWYSINDVPQSVSNGDEEQAKKFLDLATKFSSLTDEFVPKDRLPNEVLEQIVTRRQNKALIDRLSRRKPAVKSALSRILAAAFNEADCEAEKLTRNGEMDEEAATFHREFLQFRKSLLDTSQHQGDFSSREAFYKTVSSLPPQELEWLPKYLEKKPAQRVRQRAKEQARKLARQQSSKKRAKAVIDIDQENL